MDIVMLDVDELTPYDKNARKHTKKDLETIINSIQEFGMNDPIGIWGEKNIIVEGHGRLMACKELGITSVPCIRLDYLTDEQRRAYTLAHNKTAEMSSWDISLLDEELGDIFTIDMEDFGFEYIDREAEHEKFKEITLDRADDIVNLGKGQYAGDGKYDIPILAPVYELPEVKEWIGFNYVLSDDDPEGKGVHFFIDDYQFERIWNNPEKYVEKLKQYAVVATPDFSPWGDMPLALQLYNHYRKHWVGAYLQEQGVTVIPTIRASSDERSLEWFLDGTPTDSIIILSSMWSKSDGTVDPMAEKIEQMIKEKLNPSKIFVYGREDNTLQWANCEYIKSFSDSRWNRQE